MGRPEIEPVYEVVREMTLDDLAALALPNPLEATAQPIERLRPSHQLAAQLIAQGMSLPKVALTTGYSTNYLATLQKSPAFQECIAHYEIEAEAEFCDLIARMKALGMDFMEELQHRLGEEPEKFSNDELMRAIALLTDRSGYGPKSTQVHQHSISPAIMAALKEAVDDREASNVRMIDVTPKVD